MSWLPFEEELVVIKIISAGMSTYKHILLDFLILNPFTQSIIHQQRKHFEVLKMYTHRIEFSCRVCVFFSETMRIYMKTIHN